MDCCALTLAWVEHCPMMKFRKVDREAGFLLLPSVDEQLPDRHQARLVVEVGDQRIANATWNAAARHLAFDPWLCSGQATGSPADGAARC